MCRRQLIRALCLTLWLGATGFGFVMLTGYSNTPGELRPGVPRWPSGSRIPLCNERPTLILFAHPRCPCTRASLGELEKIVARYGSAVTPWVVFFNPRGVEDDWQRSDLWAAAAAIGGVRVFGDVDGVEADRFHATTSGQTMLYSKDGELLFDGGITLARGHAGDNAGRTAVEQCLSGGSPDMSGAPVFGCPITDAQGTR